MKVTCKEVWVKFRDGKNGQHITLGDGPSFAQRLGVNDDGSRLSIMFLDKDNVACKVITWPMEVIHEYTLEHCDRPPTPAPNTVYPPKPTGG